MNNITYKIDYLLKHTTLIVEACDLSVFNEQILSIFNNIIDMNYEKIEDVSLERLIDELNNFGYEITKIISNNPYEIKLKYSYDSGCSSYGHCTRIHIISDSIIKSIVVTMILLDRIENRLIDFDDKERVLDLSI